MSGTNLNAAAITSFDLDELVKHYQKGMKDEALYYLSRRGIEQETVASYRVGFEPGRIGFYVQSDKLGDFFENRVIIPIEDRDGETVDLIGRSIDNREPKYKSLLGLEDVLFNEGVLEESEDVILCSGVFDVLSLSQARLPAVCVPVWMLFKEVHAEKLRDKRVFIALGNDELGHRECARIQAMLESTAKEVFAVQLPEGIRDVNDFFVRVQNPLETFMQMLNETMQEALRVPIAPDVKNITMYTEEYLKRQRGQVPGVPTGFGRLDEALFGGLRSGLYFLAGGASSGKTMLMKQMADSIAASQTPVVYVSWDMTSFELWARSVARIIGTEPQQVLSGRVEPEAIHEANKAYAEISKLLWTIECSVDTTLDKVIASIERIAGMAGRTPVVFIDHLDRIPLAGAQPAMRTRGEQQNMLAYVLKQWSREWAAPVIAALPSGLAEEQLPEGAVASADVILRLHNDGRSAEDPGGQPVLLQMLKHRNGSLAAVPMRFMQLQARFLEEEEQVELSGQR